MLVLTRKPQQSIRIGNDITVNIVRVRGNAVQIGIEAPQDVNILRSELVNKPKNPEVSRPSETEPTLTDTHHSVDASDEETEAELEFFSLELFRGPQDADEELEFDSPLQQFMFAP